MKTICILGSTGSIGVNTLDIVRQHPDLFQAGILVANKNIERLFEQVTEFKPRHVVIYDPQAYAMFSSRYPLRETRVWSGYEGLVSAMEADSPDVVVNALVGFAGLAPTMHALHSGIDVALANKETLVVAGKTIMQMAKTRNVHLIPIDSEHSAIWQCLAGEDGNKISRLMLTASGGPFRSWDKNKLKNVTPEQALRHPNWEMGAKITIDSATMMNKGLEVIEAHWLYGVAADAIQVVIHPQSVIHSMVEFEDKSIKAQLGVPDMRLPIQYALTYPTRISLDSPAMDFSAIRELTFEKPDFEKFPCLDMAYQVLRDGKSYPTVLNAANEIAVNAFLNKRIKFTAIADIIRHELEEHSAVDLEKFADYFEIDSRIRKRTQQAIDKM